MKSNLEWLLKLINENPDLPVIPVVSDEVLDDSQFKLMDSSRWMGNIGSSEILMYLKGINGISLYSDCSYVETLVNSGKYTEEQCDKMSPEELEQEYDSLPWENAIFLNIDWCE